MSSSGIVASFGPLDGFTLSGFTDGVYKTATDSLNRAMQKYTMQKSIADSRRDLRVSELVEAWGGKEAFLEMKQDHTNKKLEEYLVRNSYTLLVEWNDRLVRKFAPVYQVPRSRIARAQLFAPEKRLGSLYMDTYWFNFVIIWLLSLVFYLALVYDLLSKVVSWNRIRQLRRNQ
jgi:hypothetical protein